MCHTEDDDAPRPQGARDPPSRAPGVSESTPQGAQPGGCNGPAGWSFTALVNGSPERGTLVNTAGKDAAASECNIHFRTATQPTKGRF